MKEEIKPVNLKETLRQYELLAVIDMLKDCGYNQSMTANMLGISRSKLISIIKKYKLMNKKKKVSSEDIIDNLSTS